MWLCREFKRHRKFSVRCVYDLIISDRNTHSHQLHWLQRDLKLSYPRKLMYFKYFIIYFQNSSDILVLEMWNVLKITSVFSEIKSFYHLIPPWEERRQRFTLCKLQHQRWPMFSVTPSRNLSRSNLSSSYSTETLRLYSMSIFLKKHSGCQRNYQLRKKKKKWKKGQLFLFYSSFYWHICEDAKLINVEFKLYYEA